METALYRIVQEAVTNVVRHARATRVDVFFERSEDRVAVMIEDNGVGFEPDRVLGGSHFGLLGIQERAEALGGVLTVESKPGAGATILVEVANADPHPGG
jgi:signal transduction histidine kinase